MPHHSATDEELRAASEQRGTVLIVRINSLIAVSIVIFTLVTIFALRERVLTETGVALQSKVLLLANQAQTALDSIDLAAQVIANRIDASVPQTSEDLRKLVANRATYDDLVSRLTVLPQAQVLNVHDGEGRLLVSTRGWPTRLGNVSQVDYFKAFLADPKLERFTSELRLSEDDGAPVMFIERQLRSASGQFLGVVGGAINLHYFTALYEMVNTAPGEFISVYRDDGTMLLRVPMLAGTVGHRYLDASMAPRLPLGGPEQVVEQRESVFDGDGRLVAARRLKSYPIIIKVGTSIPVALAAWRRQAFFGLVGLAAIEGMIFWVTRLLWRQSVARIVVARAVSQQAEAERQRLAAAQDIETLISTMPGVVVRAHIGSKYRLVPSFISPTVVTLTGYTAEEVATSAWLLSHVSRRDLLALRKQVAAVLLAPDHHGDVEIDMCHRNGMVRRVQGKMAVQSAVGAEAVLVMIWTDVTNERDSAARLAHTYKLAVLGELATGMAHELNQPLAAISMAAENAHRAASQFPGAQVRVLPKLDSIIEMVGRASSMLDHMRVFGRTGDERSTHVSLLGVLNSASPLAHAKLASHRVRLVVDVPDDLPPILAKPVPLEQVLLNLISNACDAYVVESSNPAPAERVITISAQAVAENVVIRVADHAGGIPAQVLPRIFEPFFTTKVVGKGTGLGLSISYGIITDLGGTIVATNENNGVVFVITLPMATLPQLA